MSSRDFVSQPMTWYWIAEGAAQSSVTSYATETLHSMDSK